MVRLAGVVGCIARIARPKAMRQAWMRVLGGAVSGPLSMQRWCMGLSGQCLLLAVEPQLDSSLQYLGWGGTPTDTGGLGCLGLACRVPSFPA